MAVRARTIKKPVRKGSLSLDDARATAYMLTRSPKRKVKQGGKRRRANAAFMKVRRPTGALKDVVGSSAMPRTEVTKKIWGYIKRNGLQDKKNLRMINVDDKLKPVFGNRSQVSMFEMTKLVSKHLK
jgi:chromatin remodeling complex protein RSC6